MLVDQPYHCVGDVRLIHNGGMANLLPVCYHLYKRFASLSARSTSFSTAANPAQGPVGNFIHRESPGMIRWESC